MCTTRCSPSGLAFESSLQGAACSHRIAIYGMHAANGVHALCPLADWPHSYASTYQAPDAATYILLPLLSCSAGRVHMQQYDQRVVSFSRHANGWVCQIHAYGNFAAMFC